MQALAPGGQGGGRAAGLGGEGKGVQGVPTPMTGAVWDVGGVEAWFGGL